MVLFSKTLIPFRGEIIITFFQFDPFFRKQHTTKVTIKSLTLEQYNKQMILVVGPILLRKKFNGITLWPFIVLRHKGLKHDEVFLNHERIHYRQQLELLVVFFHVWYALEYLLRLLQYRDRFTAYKNLSFEREAYANEEDLQYLNRRPFWKFLHYLN